MCEYAVYVLGEWLCTSCACHPASCARHVHIMCMSSCIMCLSCAHHVHVILHHVPVMCTSCAHHVHVTCAVQGVWQVNRTASPCRSDQAAGGRHPQLAGAVPEGSEAQPKQLSSCQTSGKISVSRQLLTLPLFPLTHPPILHLSPAPPPPLRFLLGKHKAALDTYSEALSLSPQEWVGVANTPPTATISRCSLSLSLSPSSAGDTPQHGSVLHLPQGLWPG